ncbi:MAG: DUF3413 domain-containing protein [Pasteurellaceae bacterium]|nr:DUF3413 domain-containing protein [Pasteurellaceae bacterium]
MTKLLQSLLPVNSRQYREETSQRIAWGHWFALFNIVLALLISSRYAFNADWPNTLFGKLYFFISLFGHFSFVVFALYLLLIFPMSFFIQNHRVFRGISVIMATCGMTILLVDTEVFKRFYLHLSPLVWDLLVNPEEGELARKWQLLFVPMPLILLLEMLYSRWCWHKLRSFNRQKWIRPVGLFFLLSFCATHLLYAWADISRYRPITAQKANYPLSYPMTARTFLEKHGLIEKFQQGQRIETEGRVDSFFLNYPKTKLSFNPPASSMNLLIINLSGLNYSLLQSDDMPMLQKIQRQSRLFTQHYTGSDDAAGNIVSLFYGLSGRYLDSILNEQAQSVLIDRLQQLGYQFGMFSHNGFAEPIYTRSLFSAFNLPKSQSNQQAIAQWQHWLTTIDAAPFFSYLDLKLHDDLRQNDQQLHTIWQQLTASDLLRNTLIIFTADIGQISKTANSFEKSQTQVPLMLYWQGDRGAYTGLSSHLDIVPTLMSQFLGTTSKISDYAQGIDLTKENNRRWLLSGNYRWNVAIMPNGEQYHINHKGDFLYFNAEEIKQDHARPPLALFLSIIQHSNQFVEK